MGHQVIRLFPRILGPAVAASPPTAERRVRSGVSVRSLVLLALVGACVSPTRPEDSLKMSVRLTRNPIAPGDTTTIVIRAGNETDRIVTLPADACELAVRIVDADDRTVFFHAVACVVGGGAVSLRPGDVLERTIRFHGMATVAVGSAFTERPIEPGSYLVEGGVTLDLASRSDRIDLIVIDPGTPYGRG
jgi:hypothetical protein